MRTLVTAILAALLFGIAGPAYAKPVPIDPKNPCDPLPTRVVCYENGHCFRVVLPCNPNI